MASGHQSGRSRVFKQANESVMHALRYAYFHRREKKGDMRRLWNIRINAAARANGLSYSKLIHGLKLAGVDVNRKMLAELGATTLTPSPPSPRRPRRSWLPKSA